MPILSLALFFGAVGVAQAAGWWVTSGREAVAVGEMTPDDIKGWMTVQQAADGLGAPAEGLVDLLGAPAGSGVTAATAFKDIEGLVPGFDLTAYREKVRAHLDPRAGTAPAATAAHPPATTSSRPSGTAAGTPTGSSTQAIRGSMSVREVAEANGIAVDRLLAEAGLPADLDPGTVLRDLQGVVPGFEIQAIRDAVAAASG
jgi:hypothetical protein